MKSHRLSLAMVIAGGLTCSAVAQDVTPAALGPSVASEPASATTPITARLPRMPARPVALGPPADLAVDRADGSKKLASEARKQGKRKRLTDLLMKQSNCLGECKCECEEEGKSTAKNGKGKGGKSWGVAASGNELGDKTAQIGTNKHERLTGQQSDDGDVETETTHTPEASQQAQREYREKFTKYNKLTESVLENEPIPLGHRQTIRRYFESIRPNDVETDAVQERMEAKWNALVADLEASILLVAPKSAISLSKSSRGFFSSR
jgi:hypothetical protein